MFRGQVAYQPTVQVVATCRRCRAWKRGVRKGSAVQGAYMCRAHARACRHRHVPPRLVCNAQFASKVEGSLCPSLPVPVQCPLPRGAVLQC